MLHNDLIKEYKNGDNVSDCFNGIKVKYVLMFPLMLLIKLLLQFSIKTLSKNNSQRFHLKQEAITNLNEGYSLIDSLTKSTTQLENCSISQDLCNHITEVLGNSTTSFEVLKDESQITYQELDADLNRSMYVYIF